MIKKNLILVIAMSLCCVNAIIGGILHNWTAMLGWTCCLVWIIVYINEKEKK